MDSQGGDENYEALSKYAVDLTAKAESLDPVRHSPTYLVPKHPHSPTASMHPDTPVRQEHTFLFSAIWGEIIELACSNGSCQLQLLTFRHCVQSMYHSS